MKKVYLFAVAAIVSFALLQSVEARGGRSSGSTPHFSAPSYHSAPSRSYSMGRLAIIQRREFLQGRTIALTPGTVHDSGRRRSHETRPTLRTRAGSTAIALPRTIRETIRAHRRELRRVTGPPLTVRRDRSRACHRPPQWELESPLGSESRPLLARTPLPFSQRFLVRLRSISVLRVRLLSLRRLL